MFGFVGVSCVGWGRGRDIGGGELGCERVSRVSVRCSMRVYLEKLVGLEDLSRKEAADAMGVVLDGDARVEELAVFLGLLRAKGETPEEVAAIAGAMCERMKPVVTNGSTLEIVGTGGDGADTVNISTMAAIVAAAAGAKVAKHGNRSISSKSGSADVLEAVGIPLNLTPEGVARCVEEAGIGFMFAPSHHPAMSRVQPVRRAMKIRTVFNVMGPLLNPAGTKFAIIGVYSSSVMDIMADTLLLLGIEHALVVHTEGIDELSTVGIAEAIELRNGKKTRLAIDPLDYDLPRCRLEDLKGGDAQYNAKIMREVLAGKGPQAINDVVAFNAGAGLYVYGSAESIAQGVAIAREVISSGNALETLNRWIEVAAECPTL